MNQTVEDVVPGLAANLSAEMGHLREQLDALKRDLDENNNAFFNCAMALIIFLMQCGFAFLEAGAVRSKNCTNIIIKNVLDSLIGILGYWAIGWALAYGKNPVPLLEPYFGLSEFFMAGTSEYSKFFFQFVFAATASTIISGAVAERAEFACFLTYSLLITSFVYPILTHWGWTPNGWMMHGFVLEDGQSTGYVDFAGSGMVHLCGGTISLIAAVLIGPRIGRFPAREAAKAKNKDAGVKQLPQIAEIKGHSVPFASLGGFILMFGFLAFNGGSTSDISSPGIGQTVAKAMVNTILCGAFAALAYLFVHFIRKGKWTVLLTINACLTGMVSACAGCNQMLPSTSVITGFGAGMAYLLFSELCLAMRVDDPLDAFAVHFGGGLWGLVSACLVTDRGLLFAFIGAREVKVNDALLQLGWQMVCALTIIAWSALVMTPAFLLLKAIGKMRVPREVEMRGLDIYKHGEAAYPMTAYGHGWDEADSALRAKEVPPLAVPDGGITHEKYSYYQNPQRYEHPEHWDRAKEPNVYRRYHDKVAPAH